MKWLWRTSSGPFRTELGAFEFWMFRSDGLRHAGQKELVLGIERTPDNSQPTDLNTVAEIVLSVHKASVTGAIVDARSQMEFRIAGAASRVLGPGEYAGVALRSGYQMRWRFCPRINRLRY